MINIRDGLMNMVIITIKMDRHKIKYHRIANNSGMKLNQPVN
jgi:hypothetical protein